MTGRNSVVEALRAGIPAKALHVAIRIEMDDRVKESLKLAAERGIPLLETGKAELDRMTEDAVHQGLVLQIPPYEYEDAYDLAEETLAKWKKGHISNAPPIFVALDGITDPRNLGAIIRSVSAFSGHGVIVPERRSVGVTASAWKTSAGAAVRVPPVARAANLNNALKQFKNMASTSLAWTATATSRCPTSPLPPNPFALWSVPKARASAGWSARTATRSSRSRSTPPWSPSTHPWPSESRCTKCRGSALASPLQRRRKRHPFR